MPAAKQSGQWTQWYGAMHERCPSNSISRRDKITHKYVLHRLLLDFPAIWPSIATTAMNDWQLKCENFRPALRTCARALACACMCVCLYHVCGACRLCWWIRCVWSPEHEQVAIRKMPLNAQVIDREIVVRPKSNVYTTAIDTIAKMK